MARLDIGLSSFEQAQTAIDLAVSRSNAHIWLCDWISVAFLDRINLVCDATMYRMYCAEYDIPCDYSDEDCAELAEKYKLQLYLFQYHLMKNIVVSVYDRWVNEVKSDNIIPTLPPSAKTALLNFISIAKNTTESYYTPHFMGMFGSLAEAHKEPSTYTFDVSDVQETITKEQFVSYCNVIKDLLVRPFEMRDPEADEKLFNMRRSIAQKMLMSILWMCEGQNTGRSYDPDILFDKYLLPQIMSNPVFKAYLSKYNSRKSAPLAYAICVTPETIELIPEDKDSYPVTDTFRLMLTLIYTTNVACRDE